MPKLLVIEVAALGWEFVQHQSALSRLFPFRPAEPVFPAVTCVAQASFRTGTLPREHGMVANGIYLRHLQRPFFWEQSAALVQGARFWDDARRRGRRTGILFWQQALGESADVLLSPKPVHKHHGGMIQDCYSQPETLYGDLTRSLGRGFNLMHYWGPLAGKKSSLWIADATVEVMRTSAPDLLLTYLPHLDYDVQRHGPDHPRAARAAEALANMLRQLDGAARACGYETLIFGDYAMETAQGPAMLPNLVLREAGWMRTRHVNGMLYPDLFTSDAFAVVDHQVAHIHVSRPEKTNEIRRCLEGVDGVAAVLDAAGKARLGIDHPHSGELVLMAAPGRWFAYPWWTAAREAPDYARHVDIHNKPGFDPCELFFGWPPPGTSINTQRVKGTHGRTGPGREIAWTASFDSSRAITHMLELSRLCESFLNQDGPG